MSVCSLCMHDICEADSTMHLAVVRVLDCPSRHCDNVCAASAPGRSFCPLFRRAGWGLCQLIHCCCCRHLGRLPSAARCHSARVRAPFCALCALAAVAAHGAKAVPCCSWPVSWHGRADQCVAIPLCSCSADVLLRECRPGYLCCGLSAGNLPCVTPGRKGALQCVDSGAGRDGGR